MSVPKPLLQLGVRAFQSEAMFAFSMVIIVVLVFFPPIKLTSNLPAGEH